MVREHSPSHLAKAQKEQREVSRKSRQVCAVSASPPPTSASEERWAGKRWARWARLLLKSISPHHALLSLLTSLSHLSFPSFASPAKKQNTTSIRLHRTASQSWASQRPTSSPSTPSVCWRSMPPSRPTRATRARPWAWHPSPTSSSTSS
ncbi:hypothetical protein B0T19DRAFT_175686 [Cercophora scortea]|uniref:Uncharacterized protein n=1 Tax=Cercophora scortea TaxID=314031 RepID=A0AAE0IMW7_9PEZI|nr:hypothetical protein B0T19DRAFT_175686 [Cercophora scortea]